MTDEQKKLAHDCAERAAHYKDAFEKHRNRGVVAAVILIPLGILTFPFGMFFLLLGFGAIAMAIMTNHYAKEAYNEFFEMREDIMKKEVHHEHD